MSEVEKLTEEQQEELQKALVNRIASNLTFTELIDIVTSLSINEVSKNLSEMSEEEWAFLKGLLHEAIAALVEFRTQEGASIAVDYEERLASIEDAMKGIEPHEGARLDAVRERLMKGLEGIEVDSNRFEQEVVFYIEKLDINEEKVRLANHIKYFRETMQKESTGKKLGFIAQEIGREINTVGSKSNYAPMQQYVVQMKDELEKIKEQIGNTL